ncbi:DUF1127 domain-containing protein [Phyllobacterium sp. YR531]|uniref:DUF1127 domain-containing protein n=1 Tax=Phyllobacterium sp. YR531 TaxID=1144343 RepID=UPI00026FBB43|nr:DUF1127 domain-containing protein [Phyllobacterium sp. YR531]EJN02348.1 Protein of unknown function (DUF1127) [Phyllobacterium sp. YR531]
MAYAETTGLLEIDRNYRSGRRYSFRNAGGAGLLERFIGRVRATFASGSAVSPEDAPLARLSDRMLEDIGLTRAEAIELDKRARLVQ